MPGTLAARPLAWADPAALFAAGPARARHAFWLDAGPGAAAGWSWLGTGEAEEDPGAVADVRLGSTRQGGPEPVPWGPFHGGWVGWLGYDGAAGRAGAPHLVDDVAPDRLWLRVSRFVAVDHGRRRLWAVAPAEELDAFTAQAAGWAAASFPPASVPGVAGRAVRARVSARAYAGQIERCRDAIREGDAYQLCLTTRFDVAAPGCIDPVDVHRRLRASSPAHHGGLIRSDDVALISASPERFLDAADGVVRTRPIKGTRPRGHDADDDARLAAELRASPKERAENVMIVDLMRNDLSRVCVPGSVVVDALLEVESYPAVHQLVSAVRGRLRHEATVGDLLDAAFPAGSMTGAPKLSAMSILHGLEAAPRGVFAGCFGWVGADGALDLAMVIRSIVVHPGGAYVGAGGGITWGSDAAAEVAEVALKASAPLAALGARLPTGWG
ncbi:chorismate-binding protein [Microbacterium sp. zg.Y625]|uniref:anthranilate synthase component I family protein n=1 Tax=Microbacterium jiangjiandongii TaxID=3049071 RepID=UPI00214AFABE|nr:MULTISPECIES: anthranilate synthase component I family protein [unclassified Microbacterium]MCR2792846.1 chorismate-binding protein [Microbacterium sp. zg.Y625]WIM26818.1 anthranilate synthase component I family protein [Microbacterium sp. zg-Y625]